MASSALALVACGFFAWLLSLIDWEQSWRIFIPFAYLSIVLLLGAVFGRGVGILGSVIAALVFAHSLFHPIGSLRISDTGARSSVAWMVFTGVTLSFLLLPPRRDRPEGKR